MNLEHIWLQALNIMTASVHEVSSICFNAPMTQTTHAWIYCLPNFAYRNKRAVMANSRRTRDCIEKYQYPRKSAMRRRPGTVNTKTSCAVDMQQNKVTLSEVGRHRATRDEHNYGSHAAKMNPIYNKQLLLWWEEYRAPRNNVKLWCKACSQDWLK